MVKTIQPSLEASSPDASHSRRKRRVVAGVAGAALALTAGIVANRNAPSGNNAPVFADYEGAKRELSRLVNIYSDKDNEALPKDASNVIAGTLESALPHFVNPVVSTVGSLATQRGRYQVVSGNKVKTYSTGSVTKNNGAREEFINVQSKRSGDRDEDEVARVTVTHMPNGSVMVDSYTSLDYQMDDYTFTSWHNLKITDSTNLEATAGIDSIKLPPNDMDIAIGFNKDGFDLNTTSPGKDTRYIAGRMATTMDILEEATAAVVPQNQIA